MQTYQSQCGQPKRKLVYFAKCGDRDRGEGRGVAEALFPVAERKAATALTGHSYAAPEAKSSMHAEGNCKCGCPALRPFL